MSTPNRTKNKTAQSLHRESREYRGLYRVKNMKKLANRIERRTAKTQVSQDS